MPFIENPSGMKVFFRQGFIILGLQYIFSTLSLCVRDGSLGYFGGIDLLGQIFGSISTWKMLVSVSATGLKLLLLDQVRIISIP